MAEPVFDVASASPSQFYSWDNTAIFSGPKHTDLDRLRPRRVLRRLKFDGYVELLPLYSSESPRLEQAGPSFSMFDDLSLTAYTKGVKKGRLTVYVLLLQGGCQSVTTDK